MDLPPAKRARSETTDETVPEDGYHMTLHTSAPTTMVHLCRRFYNLGWVTGTGGGISIKQNGVIYVAPSGVQKEMMSERDMFVLDEHGALLQPPQDPTLRPSACTPLFMHSYLLRNAGACIHTHSKYAVLATLLCGDYFEITHAEMIKGIQGHGYHDTLRVPVIDNVGSEADLADSLGAAIASNPRTCAVLVRRHGVYVWGRDWIHAKTQCESYDYLFELYVRARNLNVDLAVRPAPPPTGAYLLDIEGTTTPISFVKDTLFPYVRTHLAAYLAQNFASQELQEDIELLRSAAALESPPVEIPRGDRDSTLAAVTSYVHALMDEDRKSTALKQLQGHIWRAGYADGALRAEVYPDVLELLTSCRQRAIPVYIYSSGSVDAQKLLFGHCNLGNLLPFFSGHFDTTIGLKTSKDSYKAISAAIGVEPRNVKFLTDMVNEATPAQAIGMYPTIVMRPGNHPQGDHHFPTVEVFTHLQ